MAPRSTSVQPSQALPTTRVTRSRRGTSTVPASATSISSSTGNRIQKAVKAPSVSSVARTRRAASVVSTVSASSPTSAKPIQKPVAPVSAVPPARSGYGDAHADREYLGMLLYAKAVRKAGVVDEEMLEKMCKPWQEKGVLKIQWKEEYLLPGVKEAEEMMDVKKAEQIVRKKDLAEKRFLEEYFGGGKKKPEKKDPLKAVNLGKITKKPTSKKPAPDLSIIIEEDSVSSANSPPKPAKAPPITLSGLPDYKTYNYYELASLCFERNLVSGGNAPILRSRLIQDDINVIKKLTREAKPYSKEKVRERKNKAPFVPNAPRAPPAVFTKSRTRRRKGGEADGEAVGGANLSSA